jgi:hypothetical protein
VPDSLPVPSGPLAELARLGNLTHQAIAQQLLIEVAANRAAGATWTAIGRSLGISRQAATKRYGHLDALNHDTDVSVGRDDSGAFFHLHATGAVFGREQLDQVKTAGVITAHHPRQLERA